MNIRFVVFGIFTHQDRFLLYKEKDIFNGEEFYRPLGGGVEFNELGKEALKREIFEEIGEKITNIEELGLLENIFNFEGQHRHEIYKAFYADFINYDVYSKKEIVGLESNGIRFVSKWIDIDTILDDQFILYPRGLKELIATKFKKSDKIIQIEPEKMHLGIIPDGSRRWANKNNQSFYEGYLIMVQKLKDILEFTFNNGIRVVSLYLASKQNFAREKKTVEAFVKAEYEFCNIYIRQLLLDYSIKVNFAGNEEVLPFILKESIMSIVKETRNNVDFQLNLCVGYCPIEEVFSASKKSKNPEELFEHLWINAPMDILIRTGFSNSISNFLPLQNGYSRIYFINKFINDIELIDIENVLYHYSKTERRFGL